ncbi:MAG: Bax inhibitor-1/YccA family protein [Wenzhouxiangellaceae bacterium]
MEQTLSRSTTQVVSTNRVLRNTYALLSMTLLFAALMAGIAMANNWPHPGIMITLVGYFGLLLLTSALRNSAWGLLSVFALTGFMGYTLGPIINAYVSVFSNGDQIVIMALGGTGAIFLSLSAIALTTKKDFSFLGSFLTVGIIVAILASLAGYFLAMPALQLAVAAMVVLLMAGLILFETQQIVRGGQTNYIMATVTLFVSIFNIFVSLLQLLGFGFGED